MIKQNRVQQYFDSHNNHLNEQILKISFVFLALSVTWNVIFHLLNVPYSRANLSILFAGLVICLLIMILKKFLPKDIMIHVILSFMLFIFTCLYFGSGFTDAWTYYLIVPIIAALYGQSKILLIYSFFSFVLLFGVSLLFPIQKPFDSIDLSNQLLTHIIITSFSFMVIRKLNGLYKKQIEFVKESAEITIEQVVKTFVVSVEAKDRYTFGHSDRVSKYAVAFAKTLPEFEDGKKLTQLHLMGLLHDIGKINIPESVLCKTSELSYEEYELIKTHTVVGAKMIEKVEGLEGLKSGVLYHHERWDGKGYPTQKKELDIPLEARVLALADAFDAMTSTRAYRSALSEKEAFIRIVEGKGTQFDPYLVEKLESVKLSWFKICRESQDDLDELERTFDIF
ncbi:HD-GYP domain-containing protein [Neobacillus ginsengisoli]|uniref:HD superfamily phosphodiesterase n=1 Tax=Neobacillus ginsengisoli TaxID=904295 RepID=A0ABT9Y0V2_9BACI|nr:HD domain-containing phosphohydrolase [Neobacillus ginsengisoli]MDQ0201456.1 HD superfamily phosphodiesterase [Neobacillus ginsengisoli]